MAGGPEAEQLWRRMRSLLERGLSEPDRDGLLDEALDAVLDAIGGQRGLIQLIEPDGEPHVVNARGQARALSAWEREEISKTLLAEVRKQNQVVVWEPGAAAPDAESVVTLGIDAALGAPIADVSGRGVRGVLYVDWRGDAPQLDAGVRELGRLAALHLSTLVAHSRSLAELVPVRTARGTEPPPAPTPGLDELLRGPSQAALRAEVASCLRGSTPILVTGESGTGKTLLATALAQASGRTPVVRAMLGTSDDLNTVTSELFGHERGSFSGAIGRRAGLVELADGGVLVLDEVLNLHATAQQLLLDFTQFGTYRPLGHARAEPRRARVRLVAVTNGDLRAAVRAGRFREDLYYRLAGARLHMPPLRVRRGEVPALAEAFLRRLDPGREWQLSVAVRRQLLASDLAWPGNVRQLETAISRARDRALVRDETTTRIMAEDLAAADLGDVGADHDHEPAPVASDDLPIAEAWQRLGEQRRRDEAAERDILVRALAEAGGVVGVAARRLGLGRTSLLSRLRTLKIR